MDVDGPDDLADSSRCTSPDIDEDDAPALSYTRTNSTNSSLVSLPLVLPAPAPHPSAHPYSTSHPHSYSHPYAPTPAHTQSQGAPASPSEKALAALTLVMANGAGGLNDYAAVRAASAAAEGGALDAAHVGEMWD